MKEIIQWRPAHAFGDRLAISEHANDAPGEIDLAPVGDCFTEDEAAVEQVVGQAPERAGGFGIDQPAIHHFHCDMDAGNGVENVRPRGVGGQVAAKTQGDFRFDTQGKEIRAGKPGGTDHNPGREDGGGKGRRLPRLGAYFPGLRALLSHQ